MLEAFSEEGRRKKSSSSRHHHSRFLGLWIRPVMADPMGGRSVGRSLLSSLPDLKSWRADRGSDPAQRSDDDHPIFHIERDTQIIGNYIRSPFRSSCTGVFHKIGRQRKKTLRTKNPRKKNWSPHRFIVLYKRKLRNRFAVLLRKESTVTE